MTNYVKVGAIILIIFVPFIILQGVIYDVSLPVWFATIAGFSTMIGGLIAVLKNPTNDYIALMNGMACGVMVIVSIFDMIWEAVTDPEFGFQPTAYFVYIGFILYLGIRTLLHEDENRSWLIQFLVITAHNAPEGLAVVFSTIEDTKRGLLLMIAICLHNIPEGVIVALPIYSIGQNVSKALFYVFLSAIAEPLGAIIAINVFERSLSEQYFLSALLCTVAGIMLSVSLGDILPNGRRLNPQQFYKGLLAGSTLMGFSIFLLHE
jgi:ZIP family zinc transporter